MQRTIETKFFTFIQNNSGGSFRSPATYVIIEAQNASEANSLAETVGVYFNGCRSGLDCDCCDDRWYSKYEEDKGDDLPAIYDKDAREEAIMGRKRSSTIKNILIRHYDGTEEYI